MKCLVCGEAQTNRGSMCSSCGRSYDRYSFKDSSVMSALIWAAKRARRFERKRWATKDQIKGDGKP